jgi:hypothetical protein
LHETRVNPLSGAILGTVIDIVYNGCKILFGSCLPVDKGPQSGANLDFWALGGAAAATKIAALNGILAGNIAPSGPFTSNPSQSVYVIPVTTGPTRLDPPHAEAYEFKVLTGPGLKTFMVPSSSIPGVAHLTLSVSGKDYQVSPDIVFDFAVLPDLSSGATSLRIAGLGNAPNQPQFVSIVTFVGQGNGIAIC